MGFFFKILFALIAFSLLGAAAYITVKDVTPTQETAKKTISASPFIAN